MFKNRGIHQTIDTMFIQFNCAIVYSSWKYAKVMSCVNPCNSTCYSSKQQIYVKGMYRDCYICPPYITTTIHNENSRIDRPIPRSVNCIVSDAERPAVESAIKEEDLDWLCTLRQRPSDTELITPRIRGRVPSPSNLATNCALRAAAVG